MILQTTLWEIDSDDFLHLNGDSGIRLDSGDGVTLKVSDMIEIAGTNAISINNANLGFSSLTTSRDFTFPDASGTIALTSDIVALEGYK